jgi:glucose dehydrogenase
MTTSIALSPTLRLALLADAVVSATAGLVQVAGGAPLSSLLGLPASLLSWSGLFMLVYAASLVWLARGAARPSALVAVVVVGNMIWAAACIAVWALGIVSPSALGVAYLVMQAIAVFALAAWQFTGWRASPPVGSHARTPPLSAR